MATEQRWPTFSMKTQIGDVFSFAKMWSLLQLLNCAIADNTYVSKHGCVPMSLYLFTQEFEFIQLSHVMKCSSPFDFPPTI